MTTSRLAPRSEAELEARARALVGRDLATIGAALDASTAGSAVSTKGRAGAILELALGATGGSSKERDFPDLGIELKTIPVDEANAPLESTYVCTLSLADAESQEWSTSWVRAKLARVLFVPLVGPSGCAWPSRVVGSPVIWSPTPEQEAILQGDFDDVVGLVGVGRVEELTGHQGRWLQVRPKARDGSIRTTAWGADGEAISTIPRGFYLRPRFTGAILRDPSAVPDGGSRGGA